MVSPISSGGCSSCSSNKPVDQQVALAVAAKRNQAAKLEGEAVATLLQQSVSLSRSDDTGHTLDLVA